METLHRVYAGLDVHKDTVVACVRWLDHRDWAHREVRTFGTTTPELLDLLDWLQWHHVPIVAMESTGVYWKPLLNILEGHAEVLLVNPEHIKKVPGRKTDVKDCEWIAQLLQHGSPKASFVPECPIRELRDLTRQCSQLAGEKASVANRIQKVLEDADIKLGSVARTSWVSAAGTCCRPSWPVRTAAWHWPSWRGTGCRTSCRNCIGR